MKLRIASDLHVEFHGDRGETLIGEILAGLTEADVLVLAGDVADAAHIEVALRALARGPAEVVYVAGNHEFYGSDRQAVTRKLAAVAADCPKLHWLDHQSVTIQGRRFLGTPLWFRRAPDAPQWAMNDFTAIRSFSAWVYEENRRAEAFLREELRAGDVVVTHHLPHSGSTPPQFAKSALNAFFVCDQGNLIRARRPALWVHGHTHTVCDYRLGSTRVLCNPFGYVGFEPTGSWRPLDVELPPCE